MPAWRDAWAEALYGETGFYRLQQPAAHFRTSPMVSDAFAAAIARLARAEGHRSILDLGAGSGELLMSLSRIDPELRLLGVDIRPRPAGLPSGIDWTGDVPETLPGLVLANEWLDTVPATVVELDRDGIARILLVEGAEEHSGDPVSEADPASAAWLEQWWPLTEPGQRAVVGLTRDRAARRLADRLDGGILVLVDYGHTREDRPFLGGIRCYRDGRQIPVTLDGTADVTASVAVDSLAGAIGGRRLTQTEALTRLGLVPPAGGSLAELARAADMRELIDPAGLGGFHWVVAGGGGTGPLG